MKLARRNATARIVIVFIVLLIAQFSSLFLAQQSAQGQVYGYDLAAEDQQLYLINVTRRKAGLKSLQRYSCMDSVAKRWSRHLARENNLYHRPSFGNALQLICWRQWLKAGENVGYGPDSVAVFNAYMNSPDHKSNIMNPKFNAIGIGAWRNSKGRVYITQNFMQLK